MSSEISNENFDHFEEEEPFYLTVDKNGNPRKPGQNPNTRKLDLNFIGYTYKADVEEYREIGDILGMTENNAKVKAYRIIEKLKKSFSMRKSYNYEKEN